MRYRFVWDGYRFAARKISLDTLIPFFTQLANHPIVEKFDQGTMARFLTEIARSDGVMTLEEKDFLYSYTPKAIGQVVDIAKIPELERQDLEQVTSGEVRETIVMLGWALALGDQSLEEREERGSRRWPSTWTSPRIVSRS